MAPVELQCPAVDCDYATPAMEPSDALELLKMHERTSHTATKVVSERKPEKFPRPSIGVDETSEKWDDFKASWDQYKEEYSLKGTLCLFSSTLH